MYKSNYDKKLLNTDNFWPPSSILWFASLGSDRRSGRLFVRRPPNCFRICPEGLYRAEKILSRIAGFKMATRNKIPTTKAKRSTNLVQWMC